MHPGAHKTRVSFIATLPSIFMAFLPKLVCPACWPLYAGILSSLGISVSNYSQYYFPLIMVLLGVALWALGFRARQRHGYYPLILGILASFLILIAKSLLWFSTVILYIGILLLIVASIWNAWPAPKNSSTCSACKKAI